MSQSLEVLEAYQQHATKWLGDIDPASAGDFRAVILSSLKLFAGIAAIKKKLKDIADRPRRLAECEVLIQTKGLIVPFLPTESLIQYYADDFGQQRVFEEMKFAVVHGYPMSFASETLARYTQNQMRERWVSDPIKRLTTVLPVHPVLASLPSYQEPLHLQAKVEAPEALQTDEAVEQPLDYVGQQNDRIGVAQPVEEMPQTTVDQTVVLSVPHQTEPEEQTVIVPPVLDALFGSTGEAWRELFQDGSPSPEVLAMPLRDRAGKILRCLADSGCDLMPYLGRPTLAAGGKQRSGKTTLIVLMAVLEKALGQSVFYVTLDDDVYPVAFNQVASGSKGFWTYSRLATTVSSWGMGALKGSTWILDECTAYALQNKQGAEMLWSTALTGFAKRGGRVRIIAHAKTATGNGVPAGLADTFKSELTFLWTDRTNGSVEVDEDNQVDDSNAAYTPSGRYQELEFEGSSYVKTDKQIAIPDWLKFAVNPDWHNAPCPVRSLLEFFPELKAVEQPTTEIKTIIPTSLPDATPQTPVETVSISTQVKTGQGSPKEEPLTVAVDEIPHEGSHADRAQTVSKSDPKVAQQKRLEETMQKLARLIRESGSDGIATGTLGQGFHSTKRAMVKPLLNVLVTKFSDRYLYDAVQGKYFCREALSTNTNAVLAGAVQEEEE